MFRWIRPNREVSSSVVYLLLKTSKLWFPPWGCSVRIGLLLSSNCLYALKFAVPSSKWSEHEYWPIFKRLTYQIPPAQSMAAPFPICAICGSIIGLWMVDRSGAFGFERFDIHRKRNDLLALSLGMHWWRTQRDWIHPSGLMRTASTSSHGMDLFRGQTNRLDKSDSMPENNILSRKETKLHRLRICSEPLHLLNRLDIRRASQGLDWI